MTEPVSETQTIEPMQPARDTADREIARKNMMWGWALFGLFCVLFGGVVAVGLVYLWLS